MSQTLPGVGLNIFGYGVLITGKSGVGKTELGLELISRNHKFIADDSVEVYKKQNLLKMKNTNEKYIMHIRDLGFINIPQIYGDKSVLPSCNLDILININNDSSDIDPNLQAKRDLQLLECNITEYTLYMSNNRKLAILVEVIVKYHDNILKGIDSHKDFINKHTLLLQGVHACSLY